MKFIWYQKQGCMTTPAAALMNTFGFVTVTTLHTMLLVMLVWQARTVRREMPNRLLLLAALLVLTNVAQRTQRHYAGAGGFAISSAPYLGTEVTLALPLAASFNSAPPALQRLFINLPGNLPVNLSPRLDEVGVAACRSIA